MNPSALILDMQQRARNYIDDGAGTPRERIILVRLMNSACQFLNKSETPEFRKLIDELHADNENRYPTNGQEMK